MRDCIASYGNCRNAIGDDAGFRSKWDNRRSWVGHFVNERWNGRRVWETRPIIGVGGHPSAIRRSCWPPYRTLPTGIWRCLSPARMAGSSETLCLELVVLRAGGFNQGIMDRSSLGGDTHVTRNKVCMANCIRCSNGVER